MLLSFAKEYTFPSLTRKGVSYRVKRLSSPERANRDLECADALDQLAEIERQYGALPKESAQDTPEQAAERTKLDGQYARIRTAKIMPVALAAGLIEVVGVEGSIEDFIAFGDDDMIGEAYGYCEAAAKLNAEQLKNLESPGTSNPAVAGQSETTNAATAKDAA